MESYVKATDDKGVYLKNDLWRKDEIIEISHLSMYRIGALYYIEFGNEYLDKGEVKMKSDHFQHITSQLMTWLKENYTSTRGKNCFDGNEGLEKYMERKNER